MKTSYKTFAAKARADMQRAAADPTASTSVRTFYLHKPEFDGLEDHLRQVIADRGRVTVVVFTPEERR